MKNWAEDAVERERILSLPEDEYDQAVEVEDVEKL